jgi:hypothetical protein
VALHGSFFPRGEKLNVVARVERGVADGYVAVGARGYKKQGEAARALLASSGMCSQYVARPPEISNTAPVVNEHSRLASQQTSAATSSTSPKRSIGILERI